MSRGVKARVPGSSWQKKRAKTVSDRSIYPDYRLPRHRLKWPQVLARIPYTARTEKKKKRKRKKEKKEKEGTDIYIRTMRGERCRTSMRCNVWLSHSFAGYDFFNTWSVPARVCRRKAKLRTSKIRDRPLASIQALHIIIGRYYPTEARACPPWFTSRKAAFRAYKVEGSTNTLRGRVVVRFGYIEAPRKEQSIPCRIRG